MFCHPHANCYHREVSVPPPPAYPPPPMPTDGQGASTNSSSSGSGGGGARAIFFSTLFVGLSFRNGTRSIDLTPTIQVDTAVCFIADIVMVMSHLADCLFILFTRTSSVVCVRGTAARLEWI